MPTKRLVLMASLLAAVSPFVAAQPALAAGTVKFTKIHYKQTGTNLDTEYVVFKNTSGSTVQLKGWQVISSPTTDNQRYTFPKTSLAPGATLTLYTGAGTNSSGKRYWGATSPRWNDSGDKGVLKNAAGTTIDTCQYAGGGTQAFC
jgi:hypothetical protein